MRKDLQLISKIIGDAYNVPVFSLDQSTNQLLKYGHSHRLPLFQTMEDFLMRLVQSDDIKRLPIIKTTDYSESFIVFHYSTSETLFIGPFSAYEVNESIVNGIIYDHNIARKYEQELLAYYQQLEWLNHKQIISLCLLIHYLLCDEALDEEFVKEQLMPSEVIESDSVEQLLYERRLEASFAIDYEAEQRIWQCIKEGDKEKLKQHFKTIKIEGVEMLSKKSHLRNMKNQIIISIALSTRAAIDGGLYPEIAYTMSHAAIQQVEEAYELQKVCAIGDDFLFALIDRVQKYKENKYSKVVMFCKNYVFNHIFEPISIQDLADEVHLNPIYLSQLFKKETNKPLGKYIQDEKIKEAQKLLLQTNESVAEICMLLQFNNQSHFSSIFKKTTGFTPNQYRKRASAH